MWRMNVSASIQNSSTSPSCAQPAAKTSRSKRTWSVSVGVKAVKSCAPTQRRGAGVQRVAVERCGHHSARPRSKALRSRRASTR